ncbi:nuclear envelope pore membrane protein POM 121-like [Rattus rattus]|uniref:nuclear envelope pore membrane protein POM 121-like n=1 Tax=Rattus rattus TaxID=10117 RepID=UPI0013F35EB1|nr:nuclear envelope pore membrane protein POM 121-like [Rattus rattus]
MGGYLGRACPCPPLSVSTRDPQKNPLAPDHCISRSPRVNSMDGCLNTADSLPFEGGAALAHPQQHPERIAVAQAQNYPVEKVSSEFLGNQHNSVPTLSSPRMSQNSIILNVFSSKGRDTLRFVLVQPVLIIWSFLTSHLLTQSRKETQINALQESSQVQIKKKKDLTILGEGEEGFTNQGEGSPVTERPCDQGKDSDRSVSASSAFTRLFVNGVLSSFIPKPGPLDRDICSKNSVKSGTKEYQIAFKSSCKRNAIASSYSSSQEQWPPERICVHATRRAGPGAPSGAPGASKGAAAHDTRGAVPGVAPGAMSGAAARAATGAAPGAASSDASGVDTGDASGVARATTDAAPGTASACDTQGAVPGAASGTSAGITLGAAFGVAARAAPGAAASVTPRTSVRAAPGAVASVTLGVAAWAAIGTAASVAPDAALGAAAGTDSRATRGALRGAAARATRGALRGAAARAIRGALRGAAARATQSSLKGAASRASRGALRAAAARAIRGASRGAAARAIRGALKGTAARATQSSSKGAAARATRGVSRGSAARTTRGALKGAAARATRGALRAAAARATRGAAKGAASYAVSLPDWALSQLQVLAKKCREKSCERSSTSSPKKKKKKHREAEQATITDNQVQQEDPRNGLPTPDIPRPVRRKIPLLLPHSRGVPLILPQSGELCFDITVDDFDLEKKTTVQWINKTLKGKRKAVWSVIPHSFAVFGCVCYRNRLQHLSLRSRHSFRGEGEH